MKIKTTISLLLLLVCSSVFAQTEFPNSFGAEVGAMYVSQNGGQNTTTLLPMLNYKILNHGAFGVNAQAGVTGYKDAVSGNVRSIFVARINPIYQIPESDFSVEGLIGIQQWESRGAEADYGMRVNYTTDSLQAVWADQVFLGGGKINHIIDTNYFVLGLKKWF